MKNLICRFTLATVLGLATCSIPLAAHAELHSKSKEIVVMEPQDLPAPARVPGEALFLHSDNAGATYLYVEQQEGSLLSIFDVTDPAHIRFTSAITLGTSGAFDVERPLGDDAELIRFRGGERAAVLDLRKAKKPTLHDAPVFDSPSQDEPLGNSALLVVRRPYQQITPPAQDVRIIETADSSTPIVLATINHVEHRVSRGDTGTTFFLGRDGLTVVRRLSAETAFKTHEMQMEGN